MIRVSEQARRTLPAVRLQDVAHMTLRRPPIALMLCTLLGCHQPPRELIGRQMDIQIDIGRYGNDVAFWWGSAPNDVLAVIARDHRSADERASGRPAERAIELPITGVVTLRGTIEPVPYAEATYGWGLTRTDARRLATKGVYLRLHQIVP
jgi:hypothetical protein